MPLRERLNDWAHKYILEPPKPKPPSLPPVGTPEWNEMYERRMREFWDSREKDLAYKIVLEATVLDIPIPPEFQKPGGTKYEIIPEGRAALRKLIAEEKKRRFEDKTRWVTSIILPILGFIIALISVITGLEAVLHQKK
jgi:hypothetical protein